MSKRRASTDRRHTLTPEEIGARLRAARDERGISQQEAAEAIGTKQPRIAEYESGKRLPSLERFYALVLTLGLDPDTLLAPKKL